MKDPLNDRAVYLSNGAVLFTGRTMDNRPHSHHAIQIVLGLQGEVSLQI